MQTTEQTNKHNKHNKHNKANTSDNNYTAAIHRQHEPQQARNQHSIQMKHDVYIHIYTYMYIYMYIYVFKTPPKSKQHLPNPEDPNKQQQQNTQIQQIITVNLKTLVDGTGGVWKGRWAAVSGARAGPRQGMLFLACIHAYT